MKSLVALLVLVAWPTLGQEYDVTSTKVQPLTGPEASADVQALDICGTDLGTMAEIDGTIVIAFGDTFGWQGDWCQKFGPNMRSNAIAFTRDLDPSDGVVIDAWLTGPDGHAKAAVEGWHDAPFTGEQSKIPTAMVAVGDTLYLHYMSMHGYSPGMGTICNYSRFITSKDGGRTWDRGSGDFGDHLSNFNMRALSAEAGTGNEDARYVYAIGTPCGRAGGARAARVSAGELLQTEAWEYWDGSVWQKDRARAVEVILPAASEGSLVWNAGIGRWMYSTINEVSEALELRFADRPEGPWSEPVALARAADYPLLYGSYMTPSWIEDDGLTFYFIMSQFGLYNTFLMKAELQRR
ncbi:DUF4185 domain-containing protein [Frigidibacter sp. RF13]|uniref:DUF4185 domain-containing protein n=1 Tax=Frigidibacter sp. RF13 TaxID=2997340 RepID=UPI00226FB848|nr:DUF4185 domain-containing protein [Frigidibacter sp. RF13]MCY1126888.1 DUF4185 domain-containing protein [Frigidibacter sp. RF13]